MNNDMVGQGEWIYRETTTGAYAVRKVPSPSTSGIPGYFMATDLESASIAAENLNALQQALARDEAQLKRCGGDNCMGLEVDGVARWVRAERLEAAEAQLSQAVTLLASLRVTCTNDGPNECKDCLGFGVSPDTGASCGTVYIHPSAQESLARAEAQVAELRTFCGDVAGVLAGPAFKGDPRIEYIANRARDAALAHPTAEKGEQ